ncbi:MAG: trigger factor [Bacteriovoracaceae bacterium]|nr:trigger factor [Bacteriovoracaceae bacterium]
MSYVIEEVNGCMKKIIFNFENLDLSKQIDNSVLEKRESVNLKGFRKGKAPLDMVKKAYGTEIESDAINNYIQQEFFNVVNEEKLRIIGYPSFENLKYVAGEKISFDAKVEVFPEFELKEMSGLSFSMAETVVEEDDLQKVRQNYLNSKAEMVVIEADETVLGKGHFAVMNFEGVKDNGERPENMKGKEFLLEIGSGNFIPGFEEGMNGMKKSEKRNIDVVFPAEYHAQELQNSNVTFEVELLEIKEKIYPEFTDELAKELKYESVEDFETKTQKNLYFQKQRQVKEKLHQEVLEKLVKENEFDIPKAMVEQQLNYLKEDLRKNLKQQGFDDQMMEDYMGKLSGDFDKKAEFQVRSGLILDKLARNYNIETTEDDFDKKIEETVENSGMEKEQVMKHYSDENIKKNLMFAIREEKTFEVLIDNLKVVTV